MIKRLVGLVVLFLMGFIVFVCLSGFGMLIAAVFLIMHPAVIAFGTTVSSFMVLFYLVTRSEK